MLRRAQLYGVSGLMYRCAQRQAMVTELTMTGPSQGARPRLADHPGSVMLPRAHPSHTTDVFSLYES